MRLNRRDVLPLNYSATEEALARLELAYLDDLSRVRSIRQMKFLVLSL